MSFPNILNTISDNSLDTKRFGPATKYCNIHYKYCSNNHSLFTSFNSYIMGLDIETEDQFVNFVELYEWIPCSVCKQYFILHVDTPIKFRICEDLDENILLYLINRVCDEQEFTNSFLKLKCMTYASNNPMRCTNIHNDKICSIDEIIRQVDTDFIVGNTISRFKDLKLDKDRLEDEINDSYLEKNNVDILHKELDEVINNLKQYPSYKRTPIKIKIRELVFALSDGTCYVCHCQLQKWHCGHLKSYANGGHDTIDNLKTLCLNCNYKIGSNDIN